MHNSNTLLSFELKIQPRSLFDLWGYLWHNEWLNIAIEHAQFPSPSQIARNLPSHQNIRFPTNEKMVWCLLLSFICATLKFNKRMPSKCTYLWIPYIFCTRACVCVCVRECLVDVICCCPAFPLHHFQQISLGMRSDGWTGGCVVNHCLYCLSSVICI